MQPDTRDVRFCPGCYGAASPVKMQLRSNQPTLGGLPEPHCAGKTGPHAPGALSLESTYSSKFVIVCRIASLGNGTSGHHVGTCVPCAVLDSSHAAVVAAGKQPKFSKYQPQIASASVKQLYMTCRGFSRLITRAILRYLLALFPKVLAFFASRVKRRLSVQRRRKV